MRAQILISTLVLLIFGFVQAKPAPKEDLALLKQATEKYRKAKLVQMNVEKSVKSELTGKETVYKGTIYLSTGLFRMVNTEPEKSLLVYDGTTVWNEQPPSPDFPGPVQVTKTKLSAKNKSQTIFATLLTKDPITKNFKVLKSKKEDSQTIYEAEPLVPDIAVKSLTVKINNKSKEVSEIAYKDDIGNVTAMKFSDPQFKKSIDKKLFQYKPPKGAQVMNL